MEECSSAAVFNYECGGMFSDLKRTLIGAQVKTGAAPERKVHSYMRHFLQLSGGFSSLGACTSAVVGFFKPSIDLKTVTEQLNHRAAPKHCPFLKPYSREKKSELLAVAVSV